MTSQAAEELRAKLPPGRHGLPREFVRENQRNRLLEGAIRSYATKGIYETTIADVTREAALSRRTIYEHFSDSEDLRGAVAAEVCEALIQTLAEVVSGAVHRVAVFVEALVAYANANPLRTRVVLECQHAAREEYAAMMERCGELAGLSQAALGGVFWTLSRRLRHDGFVSSEDMQKTAAALQGATAEGRS